MFKKIILMRKGSLLICKRINCMLRVSSQCLIHLTNGILPIFLCPSLVITMDFSFKLNIFSTSTLHRCQCQCQCHLFRRLSLWDLNHLLSLHILLITLHPNQDKWTNSQAWMRVLLSRFCLHLSYRSFIHHWDPSKQMPTQRFFIIKTMTEAKKVTVGMILRRWQYSFLF